MATTSKAATFWRTASMKDKTGTPSTTPSTSIADGSDGQINLDASSNSVRNSDDKGQVGTLTAAALESVFLWKQPSKRRLFGVVAAAPQKRYFVVTPNELAYKEKDNEDSEFRSVWKIGSEVLSVEAPEEGSKEFAVIISEKGTPRTLRLSGNDALSAQKFASVLEGAIKNASASKSSTAPIVPKVAPVVADELSIEDTKVPMTIKEEAPSAISTIDENSMQTNVTMDLTNSVIAEPVIEEAIEEPVPIAEQPKEEVKPATWGLFSMCCSAE